MRNSSKIVAPGPVPEPPDHFYTLEELTNPGGAPPDVIPTEKEVGAHARGGVGLGWQKQA